MRETSLDKIAWRTIHESPVIPISKASDRRSMNYKQLEEKLQVGVEFEHAWSDLLHAFFAHKKAFFFEYPSPPSLSIEWQAVLAGSAEWLSQEFGLPHPTWTDDAKYFLAKPWHPIQDFGGYPDDMEGDLAQAPEAFRKRNLAFLSRNLITL
jgi:hypothetical protein